MPLILQRGEKLESSHKVDTTYGKGLLHITNHAFVIEIPKKGIIFHRWHRQMAGIEARGLRTIRVKWPEGSQLHEFDFKAWGAKDIVKRVKAKHDYSGNFSTEGGSRVIFDDKQRDEIRKERAKWAEKELKRAEKRLEKEQKLVKKGKIQEVDPELVKDVESWRDMDKHARDAVVNRSMRVPERVPDHLVWHDTWLDGDYFYTFNKAWLDDTREYIKARDSEPDKKTGAYRIPAEYVRFFHGYPYVRGNAFTTPDRYEVGWLVPAMTEEMIDVDMIVMADRPRYRFENKLVIGESGTPAILGHDTDLTYSQNTKFILHMSTLRWLAQHGRLPPQILNEAGIPDDYDADAVGRRVAGLKY